ncbi:hypothetical protein [Demequina sp. NBRC 110055]|uniref:hypothetical protein n=1 Tax=Demequina sp. NBRC 110055 TaxID=1570344 RepID=UPI000A069612|nr:hypothetical protein [Demequina sp. NBRC 110055]
MVPVGLLAIIALGLVVAYVLPQRIKERSEYALVRTEDRYSAQMRVVRSSAERIQRAITRPSTDSGEVPLLTTGLTRAERAESERSASERAESMSRPSGPLDRAATFAQRESYHLRKDRREILAERAAQAKRRVAVAGVAFVATLVAWGFVAFAGASAIIGAAVTAGLVAVVTQGARAAAAQRRADERVLLVAREVEAAATATQALRVVSRERAAGRTAEPSDVATQAIRIVTAEDLAPLAAPAPVVVEEPVAVAEPAPEESAAWSPPAIPAPSYTLKATVRQREARPVSADDYDASRARAARWGESQEPAAADAVEAEPATGALDAILARRRHSA